MLNTRLILATPAPVVAVKSVSADATQFDINFFVEELAQSTRAQNELFDAISRHLAAAGIALASNQSPPATAAGDPKTPAERAFDLVDLFSGLTSGERKTLTAKTKHKHYDTGDVLVEVGAVLASLFIIGAGVVSFTEVTSEGEIEFLRIGPGDHFGEIGMLTGHPADATLRALVPMTTYELAKEDLEPVLEARPEVSQELCAVRWPGVRRRANCSLSGIAESVPPRRVAAWFSVRLHRLFDVAQAE